MNIKRDVDVSYSASRLTLLDEGFAEYYSSSVSLYLYNQIISYSGWTGIYGVPYVSFLYPSNVENNWLDLQCRNIFGSNVVSNYLSSISSTYANKQTTYLIDSNNCYDTNLDDCNTIAYPPIRFSLMSFDSTCKNYESNSQIYFQDLEYKIIEWLLLARF